MTTHKKDTSGRVFEIQRFSIHDGPGIRTTVFLQGCTLNCIWCHNPEGISIKPALSFMQDKCIGCGYCFKVCPQQAHTISESGHELLRDNCELCGKCAEECYAKALEFVGKERSVGDILEEVLRDKPFYETSGGGMTLSGGEPTMQIEFSVELLRRAKEEGLHCAMETCGMCDYSRLEKALPFTDVFLFDYKETNPDKHREFTGQSNEQILDNLRKLHASGATIRLRCPIIPGCNDREEHFAGIAALAHELSNIEGVEIMPYHRLGESKIGRFGMDKAKRAQAEAPSSETVNEWLTTLRDKGVKIINQ